MLVSRVIAASAAARNESRGAHFRRDFPETGDLAQSAFTTVRLGADVPMTGSEPVQFTRVRPGETLLRDAAA